MRAKSNAGKFVCPLFRLLKAAETPDIPRMQQGATAVLGLASGRPAASASTEKSFNIGHRKPFT